MSTCSSCTSGNYIAQLSKQAITPPAIQNPAVQPPVKDAAEALNTTGDLGRALNITA